MLFRSINDRQLTAVHDISDGGLLIALIEMALPTAFGAKLTKLDHIAMFAEDQSRYVITCSSQNAENIQYLARQVNIEALIIGEVTVNPEFVIDDGTKISCAALREHHESWFPHFMAG